MNGLRLSTIAMTSLLVIGFTGCSNQAPDCADSETEGLVLQIATTELVNTLGKEASDQLKLSLKAIRTTDKNEKVGSFECAAELEVSGANGSNKLPITYTSEMADDGDNFYVNVYGL